MNLVDLAGSERLTLSNTFDQVSRKEATSINLSLNYLQAVVKKLAENSTNKGKSNGFIPYRNSKLTFLLKVKKI